MGNGRRGVFGRRRPKEMQRLRFIPMFLFLAASGYLCFWLGSNEKIQLLPVVRSAVDPEGGKTPIIIEAPPLQDPGLRGGR